MGFCEILRYAFLQSDFAGKAIVVILGIASAWSWSIIANKVLAMKSKRTECKKFNKFYAKVGSPLAVGVYLGELTGPLRNLCNAGITSLCDILDIDERRRSSFLRNAVMPRALTGAELEKIRTAMNQQFSKESNDLEGDLGWLSIFITVSPFMGLLGTVWGVMATFIAIAQTSSVDIGAIAPGISGALLTTVIGLIVAIPAVCANTYIGNSIDQTSREMEIFVDDFMASLQLEQKSESAEQ